MLDILEAKHMLVVIVSSNCTDRLQSLDISVNKEAKELLRAKTNILNALESNIFRKRIFVFQIL